jgi:hypothetical protein
MKKLFLFLLIVLFANNNGFSKTGTGVIGGISFTQHDNTGFTTTGTFSVGAGGNWISLDRIYINASTPGNVCCETFGLWASSNAASYSGSHQAGTNTILTDYTLWSGSTAFTDGDNIHINTDCTHDGGTAGNYFWSGTVWFAGTQYVTPDDPTILGNGQSVCPDDFASVSVNNPDPDGGVYWFDNASTATSRNLPPGNYWVRNTGGGLNSGWTQVIVYSYTAPGVTNPSNPATVCHLSGAPSFSVIGSGTLISYQWYCNQTGILSNGFYYSGVTSNTLTVTAPPYSMNGYTYYCVVSGWCNPSATSNTATLTVFQPPLVDNGTTLSSSWCYGNATLTGNVTQTGQNGGTPTTARGFQWGDQTLGQPVNTNSNDNGWSNSGANIPISMNLTNLIGGHTYVYRTYATNCSGITYGTPQTFVAVNTPDMTATVPTYLHQLADGDYRSTDFRYVLLEGNCTNVRGENLDARGFYYSINSINNAPDLGGTGVTTITHSTGAENTFGTGTFTNDLGSVPSALQRGTYYAFTSFGTHTNCYDRGISSVQHFWTLAEATMDTPDATLEVLHNSIKYTASFDNTGASTVTEYGVVYARREKIDPSHIGTAAYFPIIGVGDCIKIAFWNGSTNATSGSFEKIIGGDNFVARDYTDANTENPFLYSNTTYYLRPYVKNNAGTFYGTTQTVLTDDAPSQVNGQIASISLNNENSGGNWSDNNSSNSDATSYGEPSPDSPDASLSANGGYAGNSNDTWQSWTLNGNDYFTLPYNSNSGRLNNNSAKALFLYFQMLSTNTNNRQVLLELGGSNSGLNVYIYSGKVWVGIWNSSQRRYFSKSISDADGTNYLLNVEYNGTKVRTALNGEVSSSMLFSGFATNSNNNGIGASSNGTRYMDLTRGSGTNDYYIGKIADILMYNDCSQALRTSIMNYFDQKYGYSYRSIYTAYFGKAAAEANWDEYESEVSPFDNNENVVSNLEVYKSQKELMINLNLDEAENIEVAIFDMNGIKVGTISNNELKKGINNFTYSTNDLISGVYIVRAIGLNVNESVKVNIVK